jgi:hypothetical protein
MKKTIWQFLNSPVIVALLTVLFVVVVFKIGTARLFSPFNADDAQGNKIEALGRQELIFFSGVTVATNAPQKFVGEFRNHSRFIVQNIQGTVCFFDVDGKLIDVISKRLDGVGSVPPGESRKFYLERAGYRADLFEVPEVVTREGVRTTITFVDLEATKPK